MFRPYSGSAISESSPSSVNLIKGLITSYKTGVTVVSDSDLEFITSVIKRRGGVVDNAIVSYLEKGLIVLVSDSEYRGLSSLIVPTMQGGSIRTLVNIAELNGFKETTVNDIDDLDGLRFLLYNAYFQNNFYNQPKKLLYSSIILKETEPFYNLMFSRVLNKAVTTSGLPEDIQDVIDYLIKYFVAKVLFMKDHTAAASFADSFMYKNKTDLTTIKMKLDVESLKSIEDLDTFIKLFNILAGSTLTQNLFLKFWLLSYSKMAFSVDMIQVFLGYMYALSKTQARAFDAVMLSKTFDYKNIKKLSSAIDSVL